MTATAHSHSHPRRRLLALVVFGPFAGRTAVAERQAPALLLAQEAPTDIHPAGYLVSEKYDGVRAFWDGERLRTRSGLTVMAPAWFLQRLPPVALDGELWAGHGRFEAVSAAARRQAPSEAEWAGMRYMAFDLPGVAGTFQERARRLALLGQGASRPGFQVVEQAVISERAGLKRRLQEVLAAGGEGLMLHRADAPFLPGRSAVLLKLKPLHDAEAVVLDVLPGRGRHAGRMGALRVAGADGRRFSLGTGFSDAEREAPPAPGTTVTYTYRGLTDNGLPRFASFLRVREP